MSSFRGLESGEDRGVLSRSWLSRQDLDFLVEIALVSARSRLSRCPLKISLRISPRWKRQPQSWRDLAEVFRPLKISPRITEISARSRLPRRDLAYLGEINAISERSRWNFLPAKILAENYWNLVEISVNSPRSRQSRRDNRDLGKISLR